MSARPHILVVDDDQDIRECVRMALEDEGYAVTEAEDGPAALGLLKGFHPELLLLDYRMPGMNAAEFLGSARKQGLVRFPVVLLTASRDPDELGVQADADGTLSKPFELDDLLDTVRRYCVGSA